MSQDILIERLFETLISGDRAGARAVVAQALQGASANLVYTELFWPTYELIERLYRNDQLAKLSHHMGSRLLRVLVDQHAGLLQRQSPNGKQVFAVCGPRDADELGAQMAVDLLDAAGFGVAFAGGGIANDEILSYIHESKPDVLLMFASGPSDLPEIRQLVDTLREISACPNLTIAVGGGVFNRAEGLAEEIGIELSGNSPIEMVELLTDLPTRETAEEQRAQRRRRKRAA